MYQHPITQASLQKLTGLGVHVLPTDEGSLACGEEGAGRLLDPEKILTRVLAELGPKIA
jgi:phosphopantothenoylcysteine decarboxylase/phosphopantothenate--cysteine ligase